MIILRHAVVLCQAKLRLAVVYFLGYDDDMELLTTSQAAEALGVSARRVLQLIETGKLEAQRVGRDYVIARDALAAVQIYGKAGRPPKWAQKDE